jgi:acetyltransferase
MKNVKELLEPASIAIVGASPNPNKPGFFILSSILQHGYLGRLYAVNPNYVEVLGTTCYPTLTAIPSSIDLVIYVVPAKAILNSLYECVKKNVKAVLIVSAGFRESGPEGQELENKIVKYCKENNITVLGPNSTGFINSSKKLFATINYFDKWNNGNIAIAGQTGIFTGAYLDEIMNLEYQRLGYALSVSLGNRADFDECDFLEYVWKKENIKVVQLYLESIKNPRQFFECARKVKKEKPIILFKAGRTELGFKAAYSHTGSLAQPDHIVDGAAAQHGLIRVSDIEEFFDVAKGFSYQNCPKGPRVGVITMSGANMTMVADEISFSKSLILAEYSPHTKDTIGKFLPAWQKVTNPADMGLALTSGRQVREECLKALFDDKNVDAILFIDLPVRNADFAEVSEMYKSVLSYSNDKPLFLVLQGGETKKNWLRSIEGLNIPVYPTTRRALKVIEAMYLYQSIKDR